MPTAKTPLTQPTVCDQPKRSQQRRQYRQRHQLRRYQRQQQLRIGRHHQCQGDSNIISETVAGGAQLKLAKDITVDSVTAGDSKLNTDGLTITGGPSVTKSGIDAAGNKITNVAPGTDDADAVNYSQLKQQSAAAQYRGTCRYQHQRRGENDRCQRPRHLHRQRQRHDCQRRF